MDIFPSPESFRKCSVPVDNELLVTTVPGSSNNKLYIS